MRIGGLTEPGRVGPVGPQVRCRSLKETSFGSTGPTRPGSVHYLQT